MNLLLKRHNGAFIDRITVPDDASVEDLKSIFCEKSNGPRLVGNKLTDCGVKDDTSLYFKDLGVQISWRLVFFIEYLGPLIITPLLYYFPSVFYSQESKGRIFTQQLAFVMLMFHFIKREFETLFLHKFSKNTMPIMNLFKNCFHYWILCGLGIGYYLFHPLYTPIMFLNSKYEKMVLFVLFFVFQFMMFMTHLTLRRLRPAGTTERGIPMNWGFQFVSCANYLWELMVWICFALFVNTVTAYFFVVVVTFILCQWAKKRHNRYLVEFPNYSKTRMALIPFIY
ncbi:conserved hypothetical protein [Theileria equi strain WA]|uniref:3-oxo-5-alpha-steroid 4-dehydrogenase C-terminal domain-containing protein n=1 Tax=Theileria equi strain WA TaxID=1537102 RepID=L1LCX7_THEEQ|nr:conserved hypothetical protein [Theileria equi strain WA]EKX73267.1 conserved hypothetical protein [Theileria equi strain WA]|eukprot:XP_004832719.1 conserved hypothetical protein [Theileria equi strain WA]